MIAPPPGAGDGYAELAVRFAAADGRVEARLETRAGDVEWQPVALPLCGDEAVELAHRALLDACVAGRGDEPARRLGQALFTGLFHGPALERYRAAQGPVLAAAPPLRLRFHLGAGHDAERALHRLPWELLCEPGADGGRLLALDRRVSVVRHLTIGDGVAAMARPPRLRVLLAAAEGRAPGAEPLDLAGEMDAIRAACRRDGEVDVEVLRPATLEDLVERLRGGGFHVLHLSGHGELGGTDGVVLLPDAGGRLVPCRGEQLARQIGGLSPLRLVVLNACRTAEAVAARPFHGVATALLAHGFPAVVAMQAPITDGAAARFAAALYARLAAGARLDAAVAEGRLAISWHRTHTFEWAVPVLFSRLPGGELFTAGAAAREGAAADGRARASRGRQGRATRWLAAAAALVAGAFLVFQAFWWLPALREAGAGGPAGEGAARTEEERPDDPGVGAPAESTPAASRERDERRDKVKAAPGGGSGADTPSLPAAAVAALVGSAGRQPAEEGPPGADADRGGRSDGSESFVEPSARPPSEPAQPPAFCGRSHVLRSGEPAELPELDADLVAEIARYPDLDHYVVLYLLGGFSGRQTTNQLGDLDFRPDAPLLVSLLAFDPAAGTVRLSCRILPDPS